MEPHGFSFFTAVKISTTMEKHTDNRIKKLLFFFYPFRDSIGLNVGVPFRIGELYSVFYALYLVFRKKRINMFPDIDDHVKMIFVLLSLNMVFAIFTSAFNWETIDQPFAVKYIVRNFLIVVLMFAIWKSTEYYEGNLIDWGVKWNLILQIFAAILFFGLGLRMFMNGFLSIWDMGTAEYGGIELPRYSGTSSECGYLGPMLAFPLYYLLSVYKKCFVNKLFLAVCIVLLIISTSAFNYFIILLCVFAYYYHKNKTRTISVSALLVIILIVSSTVILVALKGTLVYAFFEITINKIIGYLTFGAYGEMDYSANDRSEHLLNAYNYFVNGDLMEMLMGHGTGAYYYFATHHSDTWVENVSEAYNLYLSTLTDRGVVGLIIYLLILRHIYKVRTDNNISNAICFGITTQLIHYFLVGNMWLYYVWQEVVILVGYEKYRKLKQMGVCG